MIDRDPAQVGRDYLTATEIAIEHGNRDGGLIVAMVEALGVARQAGALKPDAAVTAPAIDDAGAIAALQKIAGQLDAITLQNIGSSGAEPAVYQVSKSDMAGLWKLAAAGGGILKADAGAGLYVEGRTISDRAAALDDAANIVRCIAQGRKLAGDVDTAQALHGAANAILQAKDGPIDWSKFATVIGEPVIQK